jgi:hypothetical protein
MMAAGAHRGAQGERRDGASRGTDGQTDSSDAGRTGSGTPSSFSIFSRVPVPGAGT